MEPESEFREIEELKRRASAAPTCPEPPQRPLQHRGSLRSARAPGLEDRGDLPTALSSSFPAGPREKARRVSDSFFRPSHMEPILGRAQCHQLRKKS